MLRIKAAFAAALLLFPALAFAQSEQFGAGQVLGNSTAAARNGRAENVTAIFDRAMGSARGSILARGASAWAPVTPGTTGFPYVSNGAGADPAYQVLGLVGGGTGSGTAGGARTNLGLGTIATQNASAVAVTGGTITGMSSPSSASDVATKQYVDSTSSGLNILAPSTLATAAVLPNTPTYANGTAGVGATLTSGSNTTLTVDGTAAPLNTVVLVKNQASAFQNGIYTVTAAGSGAAPWVLTRATYFDQAAEMKAGSYTFITAGSTNINNSFTLQAAVTTVGTDPLNWALFASGGASVQSVGGANGVITLGTCLSIPGNVLTLCPGIAANTVNNFAVNHTTAQSDCGNVIQMGTGSTWPLTLTLQATPLSNGFTAPCRITVIGQASRAVKLSGFTGLGLTSSSMLWPTKSFTLSLTAAGAWVLTIPDGRWKVPNNTITFMDVLAGNDANDCLASGTGNACATFQQVIRTNIKDYYDLSGASSFPTANITVQLADNGTAGACTTCYALAHVAFPPVGAEGRGSLVIKGNASTPANTIVSDAGGNNIGIFGGLNVELANFQIGQSSCASSPKADSDIVAADGANIRLEGGMILGCSTAQQIFASNKGSVILDGGVIVAGGGTRLGWAYEGGIIDLGAQVVTCSGSPAYSGQTLIAQYGSSIVATGGAANWSGCSGVTGARYFASGLSIIDTATGTPNSIIPGNSNGSTALGGVAN